MQNFSEKDLPPEAKEKLEKIKSKLDTLRDRLVARLKKYVCGVALLPPPQPEEGKQPDTSKIHVLILIDDTDSQRLNRLELKEKLDKTVGEICKATDKNIVPQTVILSELWQSCYDAKYEALQMVAMAAPVHDTGMLAAVKIAEIHKSMVLKKFEKYIVSYVLSGSLVRGEATEKSDIDVMVIIDDTDVKKMTRAELKDKLRAIIIGMGIEAGEMTGIRNKLNIQVYILTDFWDSLKEANPIIFTLLRDGVPFYDRGLFMPWKQMLRLGKIKPSQEAIDMFMGSGDQMIKRVKLKLREIGMEDTYYAILTPSQAALMLFGIPPPAPRETARLMREIFVRKEKLLEEKFVKILEQNIQVRKDLEHGTKEDLTGKQIDELLENADIYLKRINRLFREIEKSKEKESVLQIYDNAVTAVRDVLRLEGVEKVRDGDILSAFRASLTHTGLVPEKYDRMLRQIIKAREDYRDKKLSRTDIVNIQKRGNEFIRHMVEHMQRRRGRELERARIRVKHGSRFGEVLLLDNVAYIVHDIDHQEGEISKARVAEDGSLHSIEKSSINELESAISGLKMPPKVYVKEKIFENLREIFGRDVEILLNY